MKEGILEKIDINKVENVNVTAVFRKSLISGIFLKIPKSQSDFEIET